MSEVDVDEAAPSSRSQLPAPSASQIDDVSPSDCIKILLATDNHIGYNEKDPIRGQDSINSFKEILELATENDVDMLLLAGDLFHENKPSRASLYQTISLLRDYTMGPRPINLQIVSDAGIGLGHEFKFPQINYEDENLNIGLPVFSIHGNHDDPQGAGPDGALAALDILSASGLVNYFGRQELPGAAQDDAEAQEQGIQVKPVLIQKGRTKLALYGIGNIRDERFHAEMRKNRISLFQPDSDPQSWFNLLLIHQNRAARGVKNFVPETGFGEDVNLVVWGHEHDCRITPEEVPGCDYQITQPGSSVATSLAPGEAIPKHVAILKIQDTTYQMDPIRLRTVRPFVFDDCYLAEEKEMNKVKLDTKQQITKFLKTKVEELIERANTEWDDMPNRTEDEPRMLPLIRLRVDFGNPGGEPFDVGNPQRFGQEFTGRVANPRDIVQFYRKKTIEKKTKVTIDKPDGMDVDDEESADPDVVHRQKVKVETLVNRYLEAQQLQVIPENAISSAVNLFIEKDEKDAIKAFIKDSLEERRKAVMETEISETLNSDEDIDDQINKAKQRAVELHEADPDAIRSKSKSKSKGKQKKGSDDNESDFGEASERSEDTSTKKKKAPAKKPGKKEKEPLFNDDSEEESDSDAKASKKKAPAKKAAPKKAAAKKEILSFAPSRGSSGRAAKGKPAVVDIDSDSDD